MQAMNRSRAWGTPVEVLEARSLSPRLRTVTLGSHRLVGKSFSAGDKVKVDVGGGRMRSYTPQTFDRRTGSLQLTAFLHGRGPGSRWAAEAAPGQRTTLFGPVSSLSGPHGDESWAWCLGDETTVGLFKALSNALSEGTTVTGAVELDDADAPALAALGLTLSPVSRTTPGAALTDWIRSATLPEGPGTVFVSGHAGAVDACRAALVDRGVSTERIHCKAYWNRKKDRFRALFRRA